MRFFIVLEAALFAVTIVLMRRVFPGGARDAVRAIGMLAAATRRDWRDETRGHRGAFVGIMAIAIGLQIAHMNQPIRYDEAAMYVHWASNGLRTILTDYTYPNNHVFHTMLVWLITRAFGGVAWVIRIPTVIAGILLVPATYAAARRLGDSVAALFASALVATLPIVILFGTNARGYELIALACVCLVVIASELLTAETPGLWTLFIIVVGLGAYTIPIMLYPAGGISAWLLVERARIGGTRGLAPFAARLLAALTAAAMVALIGYGPLIAESGISPLISNRFVTPLTWGQFFAAMPASLREARDVLGLGIPHVYGVILLLAALGSFLSAPSRTRRITLVIAMACWCAVMLLATKRPPPARVWLFTTPLACICAAVGLAALASFLSRVFRRNVGLVAATAALLLATGMAVHVLRDRVVLESEETDGFGLREAREIARFLLPQLRAGDQIAVFSNRGLPLDYYLLILDGKRLAQFEPGARASRVFLVVNERHGEDPAAVMERRPIVPWKDLSSPVLVRRFGASGVYEAHSQGG